MVRRRAAIAGFALASGVFMLPVAVGCGGGKPPASANQAAASDSANGKHGKPGDWCEPMPQPDDACKTELRECMVTCDYISDRCALLVCMGSKWTYVEEQDEAAAKQ